MECAKWLLEVFLLTQVTHGHPLHSCRSIMIHEVQTVKLKQLIYSGITLNYFNKNDQLTIFII